MKHQSFKDVAVGEAFEAIEGAILPSLTMLIERASCAEPGVNADLHAEELRALAQQLDELRALFDSRAI